MAEEHSSANISVQIAHSIQQIDPVEWDHLSAGRYFQSHAWYAYGERVLDDCESLYLLAYVNGKLAGRGSFWISPNEPLPQYVGDWRFILKPLLRKWPLLICRSPLSNTAGLIISKETTIGTEIIDSLIETARKQAARKKCSFLIFDYMGKNTLKQWPAGFFVMEAPHAGTIMHNEWKDFDDYLAHSDKKIRQHYKRAMRKAENLNIEIKRSLYAEDINEILALVRNVEKQPGAPHG